MSDLIGIFAFGAALVAGWPIGGWIYNLLRMASSRFAQPNWAALIAGIATASLIFTIVGVSAGIRGIVLCFADLNAQKPKL